MDNSAVPLPSETTVAIPPNRRRFVRRMVVLSVGVLLAFLLTSYIVMPAL